MDSIWKRKNNYTEKVKIIVKFSQEKIGGFELRFFLFSPFFYRCFTSKNNNV